MRVVSLVPSVTETLSTWGIEPVACTRFCERPDLTAVGGTKNPDIEAIVAMRPDLVVMDRHENRREDAEALTAAAVRVVALEVASLDGLQHQLDVLAAAVEARPAPLVLPRLAPLGRRVFVPIWRRPWMSIGPRTYGSTFLASLGLANVLADADGDYPEVDLDEVADRRPDLVLVPSEPYAFDASHLVELEAVAPTVRVDGQDLFWWGTRTPSAMRRLHDQLAA